MRSNPAACGGPLSEDRLNKLLDAMPRIAAAVNSFDSPEVQRTAFAALMRAAGDELPSQVPGDTPDEALTAIERVKSKPKKVPSTTTKAATATKSPKKGKPLAIPVDEVLDMKPSGEISLPDFTDEKKPKNLQDRSMVIMYWLENHAKCEKAGLSQVYTCYKNMGWKAPTNPRQHLYDITFRKKWLNTSDLEDVRLTHAGSQFVEHDLPPKSAK